MKLAFQGIGNESITMRARSELTVGAPCKITTYQTVGACSAGEEFFGVVQCMKDGYASIVCHGVVTVPYSGAMQSEGLVSLTADGAGKVKITENAKKYWILEINRANQTITFLL